MDRTDSRFAHSPGPASDDADSPFDLPARAPGDRLSFEPVRLSYRTDGLTAEKQRAFVEALADCGIVREAAARAGVSEQSINRARRRADGSSFDHACEAAHMFGARRLRSIAYERAVEGTLKGHYYRGERVSEERVHDNRLLIYLLGKTEHLLQPPEEARAVCANWEPCMDALGRGWEVADLAETEEFSEREIWQTDDGQWRTGFPPPAGFDGYEEGEWDGVSWYCRALTDREAAAIEAHAAAERARACARRDRFFGFAAEEISSSGEAEPSELSEPSTPPFRRRPETMNTDLREADPPCPSIPDQVRDDAETPHPSFRRSPESLDTDLREAGSRCPSIADQVAEDQEIPIPPTSKELPPGILAVEPPGEPK